MKAILAKGRCLASALWLVCLFGQWAEAKASNILYKYLLLMAGAIYITIKKAEAVTKWKYYRQEKQ
jgi:hypothetical protein